MPKTGTAAKTFNGMNGRKKALVGTEIAVAILAEMTAVRHGIDLTKIGAPESKQASADGNQAVCATASA